MAIHKVLKKQGAPQAEAIEKNRAIEAFDYNPLDSSCDPRKEKDFYDKCAPIRRIGEKYGKTNRKIIDRWALQHEVVVPVKGIWKEEMEQGKDLFWINRG